MAEERRPGRPRSDEARRAILAASLDELRERGFGALTMQRIATRAGVGKQTVYRWWPSKADVVLEAMVDLAETRVALPDEGTLRADLEAFLGATFRQEGVGPILVGLMAQALLDPKFGQVFRDRFLLVRRAALRRILERARARGEIGPATDLDLAIDVVYGTLWYRLMLGHAPLDETVGRALADLVLRALAAEPAGAGREAR